MWPQLIWAGKFTTSCYETSYQWLAMNVSACPLVLTKLHWVTVVTVRSTVSCTAGKHQSILRKFVWSSVEWNPHVRPRNFVMQKANGILFFFKGWWTLSNPIKYHRITVFVSYLAKTRGEPGSMAVSILYLQMWINLIKMFLLKTTSRIVSHCH